MVCDLAPLLYVKGIAYGKYLQRVDFKTYCKTCEHKDLEEKFDPCNDCLAEPMNANSDKPVYWKEAENGR